MCVCYWCSPTWGTDRVIRVVRRSRFIVLSGFRREGCSACRPVLKSKENIAVVHFADHFTAQEVVNLTELTVWGETMAKNLSNSESRHCAAHLGYVVEATWNAPSHRQVSCSVVVEALAGLLEVAVASLCRGESHLGQVLPVEDAAAQLLLLILGPAGPLNSQQLDVAGQRDSPGSQTPGYVPPHRHWPGQTQGKGYSMCWRNTMWDRYSITMFYW